MHKCQNNTREDPIGAHECKIASPMYTSSSCMSTQLMQECPISTHTHTRVSNQSVHKQPINLLIGAQLINDEHVIGLCMAAQLVHAWAPS